MAFQAMIIALVVPVVKKVMIALGLSVVTYTGFSAILDQITSNVNSNLGSLSGSFADLARLTGFQEAITILLAAFVTRLSIQTLTQWVKS